MLCYQRPQQCFVHVCTPLQHNSNCYSTELLEIHADSPTLHVLFIVGNPGVVTFYKDFVGSLYHLLGGNASITAIGHISHTMKNWEHGRLFSFEEQIDHKIDFVTQYMQNTEVPIVLVGHSIGSYISIELLKSLKDKVIYCVGLYPFLALNPESWKQSAIMKIAESSILSSTVSLIIACFGLLPLWLSSLIASACLWRSWSATAVEAATSHLLQYSTMRNVLFMTLTEFRKLSETLDWDLMRENQSKVAFLFGIDDHWGPLQMFEEISKQAPGIGLSKEREGHTHAFCCTEAGSTWVARHVASLINERVSNLSK